jgi:diguanylate cyclase (GGDEF)-like protein
MNIVRLAHMNNLKLPTLLAITDDAAVRFWIKKQLGEEFFIVDAPKKHSALTAAQTTSFDFIIVDSELEDCDAIELCRELKQILRTLTPILLITGRLKRSYLDAAKEAGVTDFLNNQLDPEELGMRIQTIRKSHSLREKTQDLSNALAPTSDDLSSMTLKHRVLIHNQAIKALKEAKKEGVPIAALMIRIDRFDELQNRIGNEMKQQVIKPFTDLTQPLLSSNDFLVPSSEGRFIILMKNKTPEQGRALAERIKNDLSKQPFQTEEGPLRLTVSIVVSSLEANEIVFNRMVDSSFKALKKAQDLIISIDKETP